MSETLFLADATMHNRSKLVVSSTSDLWMSKWGLMSQPPAHFIGGRGLRVLRSNLDATSGQGGSSIGSALQVPDFLRMQTYNPSIARLPQGVREELGCGECAYVAAARVDWFLSLIHI